MDQALLKTAGSGKISSVAALIEAGADVNAEIENGAFYGMTPLANAAFHAKLAVVRILLDAGAEATVYALDSAIAGVIETPLAKEETNIEVIKLLLDAGAQPSDEILKDSYSKKLIDRAHAKSGKQVGGVAKAPKTPKPAPAGDLRKVVAGGTVRIDSQNQATLS